MFSWVAIKGDKIRIGYRTSPFWGAHKWAEWEHNPCDPGYREQTEENQSLSTSPLPSPGPKSGRNCYVTPTFSGVLAKGTKPELAISPLPSRGPTSGRNCYVTVTFAVDYNKGDKIRIGFLTPTFPGAPKWAKFLSNLGVVGAPQERGQNQNWLPHPCLLGGPKVGLMAT